MNNDKTMTVAQLIEQLRQMPSDAPVRTEGCDCYGECGNVVLEKDGVVTIERERPTNG